MTTSVMLDLETLGTGNKALVLSIGAVKFNQTEIFDRIHIGVDLTSLPKALDFEIDPKTILWWLDEERAPARKAYAELGKVDIYTALEGFALWYGQDAPEAPAGECIWGNGSTFDNVILRSAYETCGMEYPAPFWADKCYRTIKNLRPDIKLERVGTHHSAVDDAESQARHLMAIAKELEVEL